MVCNILVHFVLSWAVNNLDLNVMLCGLCCYNGPVSFWCICGLWWTFDALMDFDGHVDLFGWTWALIIIYVIYIMMDVICADGCVDGWDIYVIYDCMNLFVMMECKKKIKNYRFGSLCRVLHSAKDPVAECHGHSTWQSWKYGRSENHFPALPSVMTMALGKDFF